MYPEILHRYHKVSLVGQGGSGKVYRAERRDNGQTVAIKVLELRNKDSIKIKRFRREALAIASLNHQNIVRIHDLDVDTRDDETRFNPNYLVMDWIEGQDLEVAQLELDLRHESRIDWLLPVFSQIANALAHAHERGVIHRDLKPANIMIENDTGTPVLIDFGLVKIKTDKLPAYLSNYESLTKTGQALGTPRFMAPEQILGKKEQIDEKADVWGFGATLYYCLTGQSPYPVNNILDLFELIHGEDPARASKHVKDLPPWLDELCARCLTRDSGARPSMKDIYSALKNQRIQAPPHRVSSRQLGLVIGVISAFAMALILFLDTTPPPEFTLSPVNPVTNAETLVLHGSMTRGQIQSLLVFNAKDQSLSEVPVSRKQHEFHCSLKLAEGQHKLSLRGMDSKGRKGPPVELEVDIDGSDPDFNFDGIKRERVYESEIVLKGIVSEQNCTLTVAGQTVQSHDFRFTIPVPLKVGRNALTVICTDLAGNAARKHLTIFRAQNFVIGPALRAPTDSRRVASLEEALETAREGDRLILAPGIYRGPLMLNKALIIECSDPHQYAFIQSQSSTATIDYRGREPLKISGLKVTNKGQGPALFSKSPVTLKRCQFSASGPRSVHLSIPGLPSSNIQDCEFSGSAGVGLDVESGVVFAERCTWTSHKGAGVLARGQAKVILGKGQFHSNSVAVWATEKSRVEMTGCRLEQQSSHGLVFQDQSDCQLKDCELLGNGGWGLFGLSGHAKLVHSTLRKNVLGGALVHEAATVDAHSTLIQDNLGPDSRAENKNGLRIHKN